MFFDFYPTLALALLFGFGVASIKSLKVQDPIIKCG